MPTPLKGPHPHPHLWRLPRHLDVWSRGLVTGRVVMRRPHLAHAVKMNLFSSQGGLCRPKMQAKIAAEQQIEQNWQCPSFQSYNWCAGRRIQGEDGDD